MIDASLLQTCVEPVLAPDDGPDGPSDSEIAAERLQLAKPISTARRGTPRSWNE